MDVMSVLVEDLKNIVNLFYNKKSFELLKYPPSERDGFLLLEELRLGFTRGMILYPQATPFFFSEEPELKEARAQFIAQCGGGENIKFFKTHAGEVFVIFKE